MMMTLPTPYWQSDDGRATLYCGDCLELLPLMASGSVDAVVTDPPYGKKFHDGGISGQPSGKWRNPTKAKFEGAIIQGDERPDTRVVPAIANAVCSGGAVYLFSQWMTERDWIEAVSATELTVRNRLIWAKPFHGAGDLKTTFGPQHESVIFATKGRHELRGPRDGDVWVEPVGPMGCFRKGQEHPNQKPLAMMEWLVSCSTDPGAMILDPFAGSGTTGVACIQTGRRFIGIELSEKYCAIAARRLAAACCEDGGLFDPKAKHRASLFSEAV